MAGIPPGADLSKIPLRPPPDGTVSNFVDPPTLAGVSTAVVCVMMILEVSFVSLRIFTNLKINHKLWWDDSKSEILNDKHRTNTKD